MFLIIMKLIILNILICMTRIFIQKLLILLLLGSQVVLAKGFDESAFKKECLKSVSVK